MGMDQGISYKILTIIMSESSFETRGAMMYPDVNLPSRTDPSLSIWQQLRAQQGRARINDFQV